jgi:hypothetical protein
MKVDATLADAPETEMEDFHCKRRSGTCRAWFDSRQEAEVFALDPGNIAYHGDVAHHCNKCGFWHLSKLEWLASDVVN